MQFQKIEANQLQIMLSSTFPPTKSVQTDHIVLFSNCIINKSKRAGQVCYIFSESKHPFQGGNSFEVTPKELDLELYNWNANLYLSPTLSYPLPTPGPNN